MTLTENYQHHSYSTFYSLVHFFLFLISYKIYDFFKYIFTLKLWLNIWGLVIFFITTGIMQEMQYKCCKLANDSNTNNLGTFPMTITSSSTVINHWFKVLNCNFNLCLYASLDKQLLCCWFYKNNFFLIV